MCQIAGIVELAEFFLGFKTQNFGSAPNRVFSLSELKGTPPGAGSSGTNLIFWLPWLEN